MRGGRVEMRGGRGEMPGGRGLLVTVTDAASERGAFDVVATAELGVGLETAFAMHFDPVRFRDIRAYDVDETVAPGRRHVEYVTGCFPFRRRVALDLDYALRPAGFPVVAYVRFRSTANSEVRTHGTWTLFAETRGTTSVRLASRTHAPRVPCVRGLVAARVRRAFQDMGAACDA
jgi:hypothetical protein